MEPKGGIRKGDTTQYIVNINLTIFKEKA